MIPLQIATWIGVLAGLLFLGSIGTMVTPKRDLPPSPPASVSTPEEVVEHAQSGYRLDTCVRDISSRTVLSDQASGSVQLIVLEGASVTECFPGLTEFLDKGVEARVGGDFLRDTKGSSSGLDMRTSVTVLPPAFSRTPSTSPQVISVGTPASTSAVLAPPTTASSSDVASSPVIPSGGGSSGGASVVPVLSVDRFDACRIQLFGDTVPTTLSQEDTLAFELCLMEEDL